MIEKFFTTEQVANILQVHPFTILKFIKQGKLKGIKLGRVYRIKESDVKEFLESRVVNTGNSERSEASPRDESPDESQNDIKKDEDKDDDQHYYII